jgi:PIN domain nuclease of toxin-antitoxin system
VDTVHVLDASALLAVLNREAGADVVVPLLPAAIMSAVNWSEVVQTALARGVVAGSGMRQDVEATGVSILPFEVGDGEGAARVWQRAPRRGLSLGDRACLALAEVRGGTAVTADRGWAHLGLGIQVLVIR